MAGNSVTLVGNLVRDPELGRTDGGRAVLNLRVAVDEAGGSRSDAGFFDCVAWGDIAENLARSLSKGPRVLVTGELRHRTYAAGGESRSVTEVRVFDAGPSLLWAIAMVEKRAPALAGS
ncbi:MAG: single-stranded DNA-binding protein [Actinomycetota bacterium]|nr:single-stranded DNA-binding protein [Actinomycetota bacterium]